MADVAMADEHAIARYRRWYRKLLRFYARPYRERFAEGMEQTFNDVCRERASAGKGLVAFVLWMFAETSAAIIQHNVTVIVMQKNIVRIALAIGCILLVPLLGNFFMGWHWPPFAFVVWGAVLFGTGLTYELIARKGGAIAYRVAVGIACATGFVLVFINAAAGIIGDGAVNLMYLGVLAVGFLGALIAHFQPRGMALALFATAAAQMLVPVIALVIWKAGWQELLIDPNSPHPPFEPGIAPVFGLNAVFALLWVVSGLLFRHAGNLPSKIPGEELGRGASPGVAH
jgi:hypothetical protein